MKRISFLFLLVLVATVGFGQPIQMLSSDQQQALGNALLGQWDFTPIYTLTAKAQNAPGLNDALIPPAPPALEPLALPRFRFFSLEPTHNLSGLLPADRLPLQAFTVEAWFLNHVNQPVGGTVSALAQADGSGWMIGLNDRIAVFGLKTQENNNPMTFLSSHSQRGYKQWLYHIVGVYDGAGMALYLNGERIGESNEQTGPVSYASQTQLEATAYLQNEPYMQLGNLIRNVLLYNRALSAKEIRSRFETQAQTAEEGRFYYDRLHFTAGPTLQRVTQSSVTLSWETDRPTTGVVEYSPVLPYTLTAEGQPQPSRIHKVTLSGLETNKPYFYRVTSKDEQGQTVNSGPLTFKTAVGEDDAFSFAIVGDPEARPHIADRLAKMIWGERADFGVLLGDLTDGGQKDHKFEWNYEHFASLNQLFSRIPFVPVVGNGEDDLHWVNYFFDLPNPKGYYTFRYGNAEFFIVDSNQSLAPGGEQYEWLKNALSRSTATWKFACHHHPTWSSDEDDYGNTWKEISTHSDDNVQQALPLYEEYGIDIVWYAHLHTYERSWPLKGKSIDLENGIIHIQAGGMGGNLEDAAPTRTWFMNTFYRGHHYCLVNIYKNTLEMKMVDVEGRVRDRMELKK